MDHIPINGLRETSSTSSNGGLFFSCKRCKCDPLSREPSVSLSRRNGGIHRCVHSSFACVCGRECCRLNGTMTAADLFEDVYFARHSTRAIHRPKG